MRQVLIISGFFILMFSCAKDTTVHEDLIIDGNVPPPGEGVSDITLNNYINNLHIDLFGRAATEPELEELSSYIKELDYSIDSRKYVVGEMMEQWEYYKNLNIITSQKFLVDVDSFTILYQIEYWDYLIDIYNASGATVEALYFTLENEKIILLSTVHVDLFTETIGIQEYYRRYLYNYFYDLVNMGSENFVIACFLNLMHRYPTDEEKLASIYMVDGNANQLFLQDGSSKLDFVNIIVSSMEFYQGVVIDIYQTLLARLPDSGEMTNYGIQLQSEDNFYNVKMDVLISEEYAGF